LADFIKYAESVLKILAILAAGAWAIFAFLRKREWYSKSKVSHKFTVIDLDRDHHRIVRVDLTVENSGEKLLRLKTVQSRLQQVSPLPVIDGTTFDPPRTTSLSPEVAWPTIDEFNLGFAKGECEVEPGETHTLQFDFFVLPDVKTVQAYSYVGNHAKWVPLWKRDGIRPKEIGWSSTDIFTLPDSVQLGRGDAFGGGG
jgi:hypothetical protein